MQIAQSLLLLLAFGLTHEAFAGDRTLAHHRQKAAREAFEKIAANQAARCLQPNQGHRDICSRQPIRMAMEREKERQNKFAAHIDPKHRMLSNIRAREASAERAAGRAHVGGSVVVLRNRNDVRASSQHSSGLRRSKL